MSLGDEDLDDVSFKVDEIPMLMNWASKLGAVYPCVGTLKEDDFPRENLLAEDVFEYDPVGEKA